jgi:branched-chain amino acid transport system ATP-binding protein
MLDEILLAASNISRRFGGLTAVDRVSLTLVRGEVHAVIGTNGAGKSTLVNVLAGELPPSSGRVQLHGRDVTRWSQPRRARAGIGRTYQRTTIFPRSTVFENCRLTAQANHQHALDLRSAAAHCGESTRLAHRAIEQAGLTGQTHRVAGTLSHGQKRQLEIAMCLATAPQVLLLDEPLAGMGAEETERMLGLLAALKPGHAILLVEHDMDAVFRIADRITVMVNGTVIATGDPVDIRKNADVQTAYLGEIDVPPAAAITA